MRALSVVVGAVLVTVLIAAAAIAHPAATTVSCPLKPGNPLNDGGDVQWGFTVSAAPNGGHTGVKTSYTHGRGNWTSGKAKGKACVQDTPNHGAVRDLVLSVSGKSKIASHAHQFGYVGVRMVVPIKVSASNDAACPVGSKGTITLFASYYQHHVDGMKLQFGSGCKGHNLSYSGPHLHVIVTRHGKQV